MKFRLLAATAALLAATPFAVAQNLTPPADFYGRIPDPYLYRGSGEDVRIGQPSGQGRSVYRQREIERYRGEADIGE